jgi:putative membrane protein
MMYGGDGWMGWGWGGLVLMTFVMVLFWAAVITAIVFGVRYVSNSRGTVGGTASSGPPRAEDLLAERYARGEIDEDEFRQRMALLREHR